MAASAAIGNTRFRRQTDERTDKPTNRQTAWTSLNLLDSRGNYSAASTNTKLVHWPLMGGMLQIRRPVPSSLHHIWCSEEPEEGTWRHTHQRPVYQSLYWLLYDDGPLLCGFNVSIKGLISATISPGLLYHVFWQKKKLCVVGICKFRRYNSCEIERFLQKIITSYRPTTLCNKDDEDVQSTTTNDNRTTVAKCHLLYR